MSILPTISALLGLSTLQMTPTYKENLSLFTICICPPSGGKNQCFSFGCKQPITSVEENQGKCLLLDKFTEAEFRQHLMQNDGVALIMNEEMEDTIEIFRQKENVEHCAGCSTETLCIPTMEVMVQGKLLSRLYSVSIGVFLQVSCLEYFTVNN